MKKTVYHNADGVRRTAYYDHETPDKFHVHTEVDIEDLIRNNAELALGHKPFSDNKLLARVPLTVYEQSVREDWDEDQWKRWLNDFDNKPFRVWQGQV